MKKGINIKDTLKLYAVLFSCFVFIHGLLNPEFAGD
jgi:hypothetical protein